ncbi:protein mono-ADP-ribosyltransferase PARP10-like isoform X1 [Xyrauchen texanus]|uniref:protein mono-ADP-ribosyltransferase PARP10-like isoform X1 n=2 Tax=Xyrauchen texanus TaxID=154827 RepID=UPI002242BD51|nr:protein mono-ADP-ribosyltransferase PARP10-like isoform X1 [Xyrauchen texanus]
MAGSSLEERTLEVLDIPDDVDDDLLWLYFENKRRSGGGDVVSLERHGNKAVMVFEEAEVAARVLAKTHVLQESTLTVRKKPPKDPGKLLLRGLNPNTSLELVELYVENLIGMESGSDFFLYPSPSKDLVLIHLQTRLSKDFQTLSDKISKKPLEGAKITLEQIESTDSIMVANLTPNVTEDMLELYFGSNRGGGADVLGVTMLADGCAKVLFKDVKSVDCVLQKSHNLEGTDLIVKPYFDFLQEVVDQSTERAQNGQGTLSEETDQNETRSSSVSALSPTASDAMTGTSFDHSVALTNNVTSLVCRTAATSSKVEPMETEPSSPKESYSFISVPDTTKHQMLSLSNLPGNLTKSHPNFEVSLKKDGVQIKGPDQLEVERLKNKVLEFLSGIAQVHLTNNTIKAEFLGREDVKTRLLLSLRGLPSTYSVSDCMVTVTSLSHSGVKQACDLIESHIAEFTVPIAREYESVLFSQECSDFLDSLDFCSAKVSDTGEMITAVTLKGIENTNRDKIVQFLSTPIQRETVLSMEPGMLTFLQLHHRDLLADMGEVILFPLETGDGLSIQGDLNACLMAEEVLRSVIDSTCTKCSVVSQPGICRFLLEEGASILAEMTAKFQVYINMEKVHWEPLEDKDIFELAWKMTPCQNIQRNSSGNSVPDITLETPVVSNPNATDANTSARIEEAKRILSVIGSDLTTEPSSLGATDMEEEDLYSDQGQDVSAMQEDNSDKPKELQTDDVLSSFTYMNTCSLEEDARLSLAIQLSMESNKRTDTDDLQKALELSKSESMPTEENMQFEKAVEMSLQDAIKLSNTAEIFVYANYTHDLVRVDIALGKKVGLKQCEEKCEHKNLRKLSIHQKRCIELIKRKHAVEINIQGTTAIISGFKDYVSEAVIDLKSFLKRTVNMMSDDEIIKSVQWVWHEQGSAAAIPYPPDAIVFIENAWKMKQKKIDILFNNQPYSIDFEKMEEHSLASGKSVPIKRKMLSAEDLYTDGTDEDYSLLSNMPEVSKVDVDSDEFQKVIKDFYDTIQEHHNRIKIIKVEKLTNKLLYDQYRLKKASMEASSSEPEVERTLYHGTSETSVKEICIHGFNRSFCGKNATVYGQGVYFAVNSALSVSDTYSPPNGDGHKFILVARVLTGDFTVGQHAMKTAPLKESSAIPVRYHSVTDKISDPTLFVIFNDTQAYPEYLITCKKIYS